MSLLMIMDIDHFSRYPSSPDELIRVFQTYRSPMAANLQFVFYTPKKKGADVLVKVLLNGEEAQLGFLQPFSGPYYKWADVRTYLENRVSLFVDAKN